MARLIDVYPYRKNGEDRVEFLILRRSVSVSYSGQWRMVGGKVKAGEKAWQAGLRELKEETALEPELYWTIPSINHFYNHRDDRTELIPAFAAEIDRGSRIILNREHTDYKWIEGKDMSTFIHWPEQHRLMQLANKIITNKELLDDWKISF